MNPDSTLAVTKTCPKDGVHLSAGLLPEASVHENDQPHRERALVGTRYVLADCPYSPRVVVTSPARLSNIIGFG